MRSSPQPSKPGALKLPTASHSSSLAQVYDWLKETVEQVAYGKVAVEFTIHQSQVTRVQKTVVVSEIPK